MRLIPALQGYGFKVIGTLKFLRERDTIFDIISFAISHGGNLAVSIRCWVPEMSPEYDFKKFPKGLPSTMDSGGALGRDGIDEGATLWYVDNLETVSAVLDDILGHIKVTALPWFASIDSREKLVADMEARAPSTWREQPRFQDVKKNVLNPRPRHQ